MVMRQSSHDDLQHPRRNLGNRYRTQAQKFVRLAKADPERKGIQYAMGRTKRPPSLVA